MSVADTKVNPETQVQKPDPSKDNEADKGKDRPAETCQDQTKKCENQQSECQAEIGNQNDSMQQILMMLAALFMQNQSSDSSSSSDNSGYKLTIVKNEVAVIVDSRTKGDGSGKDKDGDGNGDGDGSGKDPSGGDPSDLTDYSNVKNKFPSSVETNNPIEKAIVTSVPDVPSRLKDLEQAAKSSPRKATDIAQQKLVPNLVSTTANNTTRRDRQVMRISTLAETYAIGVATLAAVEGVVNTDLPSAPKSAQDAAKQNGISKIKRAVPYTLAATAKAAAGRTKAMGDLDVTANYSGTESKGHVVPGNTGECPVCPPQPDCDSCTPEPVCDTCS